MATRDALEAERYRSALQRDFLLQKPRLVRWLAVLALTGVGLLWALSSSAAAPHAARSTPSATSARGSSGDSTEFAPH